MAPDRTDDGRRGRPDVLRIGDLSPDEVDALVKRRRRRRKLKALGAIGLALAAGTFLSCASSHDPSDDKKEPDGGADAGVEAGVEAGITDATVDVDQHRDGMPVPDNLLE